MFYFLVFLYHNLRYWYNKGKNRFSGLRTIVYLCRKKKMYTVPQSEIILFSVEGQILADSILMDSGSLPDAVEGDTGSWGDWL